MAMAGLAEGIEMAFLAVTGEKVFRVATYIIKIIQR